MRKLLVSLFVLNLLLTFQVHANSTQGFSSGFVDYGFDTKHSLSIAPEFYHYEYEEPGVMKLEGQYTGIQLDYAFSAYPNLEDENYPFGETIERFFFGLESRYATGDVDYESNGSGSINGIDDYVAEIRVVLGFEAKMSSSVNISPYLGYGYRYLNNDSSGKQSTTGQWGYERESNYFYLPLGARLAYFISPDTQIGASLEGDVFLFGTQRSHLGDVSPFFGTVENHQDSGYGIRASVFIEQDFQIMLLFIEPYIRYWDIADSNTTTDSNYLQWVEPENNTLEAGLKMGVRF